MRIPEGAPIPLWTRVYQRFPALRPRKIPLGTIGVVATLGITGAAVYALTIYPAQNREHYREVQRDAWERYGIKREQLTPGQNEWRDPFERKK